MPGALRFGHLTFVGASADGTAHPPTFELGFNKLRVSAICDGKTLCCALSDLHGFVVADVPSRQVVRKDEPLPMGRAERPGVPATHLGRSSSCDPGPGPACDGRLRQGSGAGHTQRATRVGCDLISIVRPSGQKSYQLLVRPPYCIGIIYLHAVFLLVTSAPTPDNQTSFATDPGANGTAKAPARDYCYVIRFSAPAPAATRVPMIEPGAFVSSKSNLLGVGKFRPAGPGSAVVEYFIAPGLPMQDQAVPLVSLTPVRLEEETRVYARDAEGTTWRAGRALVSDDEGRYLVQFANQEREFVEMERLFARCNLPIPDPADFLAARITETPWLHARRAAFVRAAIEQRQACAGLAGLLSSAIDLEPHQIEVVRRVL
jgi:hypothetical protein